MCTLEQGFNAIMMRIELIGRMLYQSTRGDKLKTGDAVMPEW